MKVRTRAFSQHSLRERGPARGVCKNVRGVEKRIRGQALRFRVCPVGGGATDKSGDHAFFEGFIRCFDEWVFVSVFKDILLRHSTPRTAGGEAVEKKST